MRIVEATSANKVMTESGTDTNANMVPSPTHPNVAIPVSKQMVLKQWCVLHFV